MEISLSDEQDMLIKEIAVKQGFSYFHLRTSPGSSKGDNYLGVITRVSISDADHELKLIVKSAAKSEILRKQFPIREVYLREVYVYKTIFPTLENFQKEEGCFNGFSGYAKLYDSCDRESNECLIFEDLKANGYQLWNRKLPMNSDHIELVFKEYGKMHAISLAMKEKRPDLYKAITKSMGNLFAEFAVPNKKEADIALMKSIIENGLKAAKGHQYATNALEKFASVAPKYFLEDINVKEDHIVIVHADCWCNNMLFKYENIANHTPTKVCLIDWQQSMVGSPAMDLTHFFFSSAPKEILNDYERYLKIYHNTVCNCLKDFGCDPETLFPFTLLEDHWRKYVKFGIFQSLIIVKLMLSESHEVPDMEKIADSGKNFIEEIRFDTVNNQEYSQRVIDMITVAAENDWI